MFKCSSSTPAFKTLNGGLPPEDGSDRRETLPKRVSDDSQHLIFRRPKKLLDEIFGATSQHEINDASFWRSHKFWSVISRFSLKNDPFRQKFKSLRSLAKGLKGDASFCSVDFGPKLINSFCSTDHMMIWWWYDMMIWWYGIMTAWKNFPRPCRADK